MALSISSLSNPLTTSQSIKRDTHQLVCLASSYPHKNKTNIMFGKVKQAIRVGRHVTDLMRLECVYSCHKEADGTLCYLLYDWDERGQYVKAHEGQWLCEGYDGKWTVTDDPPAKDV